VQAEQRRTEDGHEGRDARIHQGQVADQKEEAGDERAEGEGDGEAASGYEGEEEGEPGDEQHRADRRRSQPEVIAHVGQATPVNEGQNLAGFRALNDDLRQTGTSAQAYAATMVPVTVAVSYANYAIVAVVGALMALFGQMDAGSLASYLVFVRQAAMPINQLTQLGNFLLTALAGAERIFEVMELPAKIRA